MEIKIHIKKVNLLIFIFTIFASFLLANQVKAGWDYESVAFYASSTQQAGLVPVYRFYNRKGTDHFYTTSEIEKDSIINSGKSNWKYEYIAFYVPTSQLEGYLPVYRFLNKGGVDHMYTSSEVEKSYLTGTGIGSSSNLGPEITVGILGYDKSYSKDHSFRFQANESYTIKDENGNVIATKSSGTETKVKYAGGGNLRVYGDGFEYIVDEEVNFDAADGDSSDTIFKADPKSYDHYRGKMRVKYSDSADEVWIINVIPLEQYTWGMGEITGTGDMDYNKVMTTLFRTYGYWKIEWSTQHAAKGFKVDATAGDQIYYGYDWEITYTRIREAAEATRGEIVTYDGDVAITPYSSWTDGRTRSLDLDTYPHCRPVDDPWGKHRTKSTSTLLAEGNHMIGVSAHGALSLAGDHGWDWERIIKYYYTDVRVSSKY